MNVRLALLFVLALLALGAAIALVAAPRDKPAAPAASGGQASASAAPAASAPSVAASAPAPPSVRGRVVETMSTAGYTYVRVQPKDGAEIWAAAPEFAVKVGDEVVVPTGMPMADYESKTLGRTFDVVYFASAIVPAGASASAAAPGGAPSSEAWAAMAHSQATTRPAPAIDLSGIAKAPEGYTVAEVIARRAELSGKPVAFRGRVVKFTPAVMGKNWLHVRDGSGTDGQADLTVTTDAEAARGDLVLVRGTVVTNQDFGSGYAYDVLVQDATLARE